MARFLVIIEFKNESTKDIVSKRMSLSKGRAHEVVSNTWILRGKDSHSARGMRKWIQTLCEDDDRIFVTHIAELSFANAKNGTNNWLRKY